MVLDYDEARMMFRKEEQKFMPLAEVNVPTVAPVKDLTNAMHPPDSVMLYIRNYNSINTTSIPWG
jgi:hypothetical protein